MRTQIVNQSPCWVSAGTCSSRSSQGSRLGLLGSPHWFTEDLSAVKVGHVNALSLSSPEILDYFRQSVTKCNFLLLCRASTLQLIKKKKLPQYKGYQIQLKGKKVLRCGPHSQGGLGGGGGGCWHACLTWVSRSALAGRHFFLLPTLAHSSLVSRSELRRERQLGNGSKWPGEIRQPLGHYRCRH